MVVIGPGLGRDELVHNTVIEVCSLGCADHLKYSMHPQTFAVAVGGAMSLMHYLMQSRSGSGEVLG